MITKEIAVKTSSRTEFVDITPHVTKAVEESGIREGICVLYVPHTTAAVTINENADPSVKADIVATLSQLVPADDRYRHIEGNADAHIKATLVGHSQTILLKEGRLSLGTWQGVFFCEFDGPRHRTVVVRVL